MERKEAPAETPPSNPLVDKYLAQIMEIAKKEEKAPPAISTTPQSHNLIQKIERHIAGICGAGLVLIGLFPPWVLHVRGIVFDKGYAFIANPPASGMMSAQIDVSRLIVQWVVWLFVCGALFLASRRRR